MHPPLEQWARTRGCDRFLLKPPHSSPQASPTPSMRPSFSEIAPWLPNVATRSARVIGPLTVSDQNQRRLSGPPRVNKANGHRCAERRIDGCRSSPSRRAPPLPTGIERGGSRATASRGGESSAYQERKEKYEFKPNVNYFVVHLGPRSPRIIRPIRADGSAPGRLEPTPTPLQPGRRRPWPPCTCTQRRPVAQAASLSLLQLRPRLPGVPAFLKLRLGFL